MKSKEWGNAYKLKYEKIRMDEKDLDLVILLNRIGWVGNRCTRLFRQVRQRVSNGILRGAK